MEAAGGGLPPRKRLCAATAHECERPAAALESPASGSTPSTSGQAGVVFEASVDRSDGLDDPVNQPDEALHVERREAPASDKEAPLPEGVAGPRQDPEDRTGQLDIVDRLARH